MPDETNVQGRIKEAMGDYPPRRFAKERGYHHQTVYNWLKPGAKPRLEFLFDVAEKFGVSLDWLVHGQGPKDPEEAAKQPGLKLVRIREVAGGRILGPAKEGAAGRAAEDEAGEGAVDELRRIIGHLLTIRLERPTSYESLTAAIQSEAKKPPEAEESAAEDPVIYKRKGKGRDPGEPLYVQLQHLSNLEVMTPAEYKERVGELEGAESYTAIPLVADPVAAGPGAVIDAKNIEGFAIIYAGWVPAGRVTAVRVTGESMVPTLPPGSLIAVHHEARDVIDGDLYCLYDRAAEGAIVKRVRKTNVETDFLVESDNPDKKAHPTAIWNRGAPEEGQAYTMIGRVIWSWTRFE